MNVCFDTLAIGQPVPLIVIAMFLLVADLIAQVITTRKPFTIGNLLDLIAIFGLILSFSLYGLFKNLVFLQIVALLKLHDTIYFN